MQGRWPVGYQYQSTVCTASHLPLHVRAALHSVFCCAESSQRIRAALLHSKRKDHSEHPTRNPQQSLQCLTASSDHVGGLPCWYRLPAWKDLLSIPAELAFEHSTRHGSACTEDSAEQDRMRSSPRCARPLSPGQYRMQKAQRTNNTLSSQGDKC